MVDDALISLENLSFSRATRQIYDNINLTIRSQRITAIMGPSGCGKTTLLRLIGGQLMPDNGRLSVMGDEIPQLSRRALFAKRRQMGMLFQSGALLTDLNVFDNIAFPMQEHYPFPESMIRDLVLMKLELVGLRGAYRLMPNELSGGMARRVALARAIALDPKLMMYDEPFVGLDPITMGTVVRLIRELHDALQMTSLVVTHDIHEVMTIADDLCLLANGKVVACEPVEVIKRSPSAWVQQFIQGLPDGPVPFHYPAKNLADDLGLSQPHSC
ncbi:MAG TPA: ABC transporter ATP-binding protein [Thiothrix sp.]|nr:ABC transporter ATP-binding protein [Thiothrix sp.]